MRNIFLTVCCLTVFTAATAQYNRRYGQESKHELSIYGLGGYSPVSLALDSRGSKSGSMGGGAGLGYTFNINSSIGIVTGIEMAMHGAEISFGNIPDEYVEGTGEGELHFMYSLSGYKEKQSITVFSIPVMAQYSLPLGGGSTKFYASGGFKIGFPLSGKAEITPGTATASGHYSYEDETYEDLPQHGMVTDLVLRNVKQDLKPGFSASLALEAGARFSLTDRISLYTGVYFDYGLNSIQKTDSRHLLEYDSNPELTSYESILKRNSVLETGLVSRANLLSAGLKVRIGFKL
jgi:hypothetical protein